MQTMQSSRLKPTIIRLRPEMNGGLLDIKGSNFDQKLSADDKELRVLRDLNGALTRLKLTKNESRVYLFLARHGVQRVQRISETLKIQRTEAYKILRNMESKGVIFKILERPLRFKAVPFEKLLNTEIEERRQRIHTLENKNRELIDAWNNLYKIDESEDGREVLQVLEGKRQVSAKVTELLRTTIKKLSIVVDDRHFVWLYNSTFFEDLDSMSKERDIDVKILTKYSPTSTFVIEQLDAPNCDLAFLHNLDQPSFILSDSGTALILSGNNELSFSAMETNYASILKSYQNLFSLLWKSQFKK